MHLHKSTMRLIPVFIFCMAAPAWAGIYKWIDADGNVHFADKKPAQTEVKRIELKNSLNAYSAVDVSNATAGTAVKQTPSKLKPGHVKIFTTEWCSYCKTAKRYFKSKGIRFSEHDIEKSAQADQEYRALGGGGVPLILIGHKQGNRLLSGFSVANFEAKFRQ